MLHTKFHCNRIIGFGEEILKGFYHIWSWRSFLPCDPDLRNKLSFPKPIEAPYEYCFDRPRSQVAK